MSTTITETSATAPDAHKPGADRKRTIGISLLLAIAFMWPIVTAQPRDIGLAVSGPAPAVAQPSQ